MTDIDETLESRSMLVYGVNAMKKMKKSRVALIGSNGIGAEIAKNVALAGVLSLTLYDFAETTASDLGTSCFVRPKNTGLPRLDDTVARVRELNAAVRVNAVHVQSWTVDSAVLAERLDGMTCVVFCQGTMREARVVNAWCRAQGIAFVWAQVSGVVAGCFVDCGDDFVVRDATGEDPAEIPIGLVDVVDGAYVVTVLGGQRHGLETGDVVRLSEIQGLDGLNGLEVGITVVSPFVFALRTELVSGQYRGHGLATQVKQPKHVAFQSMEVQLARPSFVITDFAKLDAPAAALVGFRALDAFRASHNEEWPRAWHEEDAAEVVRLALALDPGATDVTKKMWQRMAFTARGELQPLTAFLGGVVAQEVLKSLSGKFSPIHQWMFVDAMELVPETGEGCSEQGTRDDALRICCGQSLVDTVAEANLFMVGVGAIGCEMLKNFALLGACTKGTLTITDPDLIEKSNLNRQFLFRNKDIGASKAERAAAAACDMNPSLQVVANLDKVGADTEDLYDNTFFRKQSAVVNALDNVAARLYVDERCVANQRALLESGTLGPKGHVQVIVPHLTESYSSQRDPPEKDVPFCTLKSFPSKLEHTAEWARDFAFGGHFVVQPETLNRLAQEPDFMARLSQPSAGGLDGRLLRKAAKAMERRPLSFEDCVRRAVVVFDKHYRHKALTLLHIYPPDMTTDDKGTLFWAAPKRAPTPIEFDPSDPLHRGYVRHFACLFARVWHIVEDVALLDDDERMDALFAATERPVFVPKKKKVVTDESLTAADVEEDAPEDYDEQLKSWCTSLLKTCAEHPLDPATPLNVAQFEKDDDSNHHIDFIHAAANLRARMYGIVEGERLKVKSIAGRIMPAIATTTSCVSGLAALELLKVLRGDKELEQYKNAFINLALPFVTLSEPRAAEKKKISDDVSITLWDSWEVRDVDTLQELIDFFDDRYSLVVTGVTLGAKMVFMSFLPMHKKRKAKAMRELLNPSEPYCDLTIAFKDKKGKAVNGPAVRFWFKD